MTKKIDKKFIIPGLNRLVFEKKALDVVIDDNNSNTPNNNTNTNQPLNLNTTSIYSILLNLIDEDYYINLEGF